MKFVTGIAACAASLSILFAAPAAAQHHHGPAAAPAAAAPTEGVIKKIDKSRGMATISHGPIANLGMDAMTMAFRAKDPKMLDAFKAGDKVRFVADYAGGEIVIVRIEAAK